MERSGAFVRKLVQSAGVADEPLPGVPLVEVYGDRRVLIENHSGVTQYDTDCICVKVKFGQICIIGSELCMARMTKGQLIVTGCISQVQLKRGCR